jgi:subtilisin family serine protease
MGFLRMLTLGTLLAAAGCAGTPRPEDTPIQYYAYAAAGRDSRTVFSRDPAVRLVRDYDHLELSVVRTTRTHLEELKARGDIERYAEYREYLATRRDHPVFDAIESDGTARPYGTGASWAYASVRESALRRHGLTGRGRTVANLDTGIYPGHEAFLRNTIRFHDHVNHRTAAYDDGSHGTWTHGITARLLPEAGLVAVKILRVQRDGDASIMPVLLAGLDTVIAEDPDVVNMSLGFLLARDGGRPAGLDDVFAEALERVHQRGILMVAATGNEKAQAEDGLPVLWPARSPYVISVGGSNKRNEVLSISNLGADVYAPGYAVRGPDTAGPDAYDEGHGTSASAPFVAAALAALCERHGHRCTLEEARRLLRERSDIETSVAVTAGKRETVTFRLLNLERLLE